MRGAAGGDEQPEQPEQVPERQVLLTAGIEQQNDRDRDVSAPDEDVGNTVELDQPRSPAPSSAAIDEPGGVRQPPKKIDDLLHRKRRIMRRSGANCTKTFGICFAPAPRWIG
jgi:hypothetical protein